MLQHLPQKLDSKPTSALNQLLPTKMRFIMITTVAASVAVAMGAVPALDKGRARLCSANTASNPVCCGTVILGVLGLDCATREFYLRLRIKGLCLSPLASLTAPKLPQDIPDFHKICADSGKQAMCCLLGVVRRFHSILVVCFKPDGTWNRRARLSLALLPSKFGDDHSRIIDRGYGVMKLFEKAERK